MGDIATLYFVAVVVLGGFLLINLTLAIIKVKYTEANENMNNKMEKE